MESSVIVEGFQRSEEDYGILYRYYIGDGDSSVFTRIQEKCKYGRFVRKIECANHMTRCLNDKLHKLAENTEYPIESRKLLSAPVEGSSINRIERIVKGVRTAIKGAGKSRNEETIKNLQENIKNSIDHVFGRHAKCGEFCNRKGTETNLLDKLDQKFLMKMRSFLENMEKNAETLAYNQTTNVAERFMGIVAKFTGGKRVNYSTSGSYRRRCYGAGLSHTKGPSWHLSPWKRLQKCSPGKIFRSRLQSREKSRVRRSLLASQIKNRRKKKIEKAGYDSEYGPLTVEPDISEEEMTSKSEAVLKTLQVTQCEAEKIERATVGQHSNSQWHEVRMNRLTASRFGAIVKRKAQTSCHNEVKTILYPKDIKSDSMAFGKQFEDVAIEKYEEITRNKVEKCGFFVDVSHPYLGASPDGLIGTDGIVEVKCLYSVSEESLREAASKSVNTQITKSKTKKNPICLEVNNDRLMLKKNHIYQYQIQGQLNICKRDWCDFIVYARTGEIHVERIVKQEALWKVTILPKLVAFYMDCILPEIVDSRIRRGLRMRDPLYILEAQEKRPKKKTKNK